MPPLVDTLRHWEIEGWQEDGLLLYRDTTVMVSHLADHLRRARVVLTNLADVPTAQQPTETAGDPPGTHGAFVYVPRSVTVERPLRIAHVSTTGKMLAPKTVVVLEPESEATVIEETIAEPTQHAPTVPTAVRLFVRTGARLRYYYLQNWGRQTDHTYAQTAQVEQDGHLLSLLATLGSRVTRASVETKLVGPGAHSDLYGVAFGDTQQRFEYHTLQDHVVGRTTSDLLYKTALEDQAASRYTGLIRIARDAQKTDAYQANRNLLLSQQAKADSIPMLEILADDVRCTHGATVGPVDPEQSFYLMSRGLPFPTAEQMIVEGFFEQVLQKLPSVGLRERLHAHIERKLRGHA